MLSQPAMMVTNISVFYFTLTLLLSSIFSTSIVMLSSFLYDDLSSSSNDPFSAMHFANNFSMFDAAVLPSNMAAPVRNSGRSKDFSAA